MNVTSLSPSYLFPLNSTANTASSASSVQQQADVLGFSPASQFLDQLQQLQTQNPQEFQATLTQITGQLEQAAGTASSEGNTAQANQLTTLADTFQNADSGGPLPTAQQLQQDGFTDRHQHGGGGQCSGSGSSQSSSQSSGVNALQALTSAYSQNQNQSLSAILFS